MTSYDSHNIFSKILQKEIPCTPVYEDEHTLAFEDIQPCAPVHLLVIPKGAYVSFDDFNQQASQKEQHAFWTAVRTVATLKKLDQEGYRLITNHGVNSGQEVPHFHVHILGGEPLGPLRAKS